VHPDVHLAGSLAEQAADKDATDYFRGIVRSGEKSERVLALTEHIIRLNPAHYSAWSVQSCPFTCI
jgi:protein farnesyltransferase/geranylgeranyltransferase type-1 subunit alpha